jgi:hypothetical protein
VRGAEKQQDRRVGYGIGQNAGRVRDGDMPASRSGNVDVVIAN